MNIQVKKRILLSGTISGLEFSTDQDMAQLRLNGKTVEYRNEEKKHADHLKKIRASVGNEVITIGENQGPLLSGQNLENSGILCTDKYNILKGTLEKTVFSDAQKSVIVLITHDGERININSSSSIDDTWIGKNVTCICNEYIKKHCVVDNCQSDGNCAKCVNYKSQKTITIIRIE